MRFATRRLKWILSELLIVVLTVLIVNARAPKQLSQWAIPMTQANMDFRVVDGKLLTAPTICHPQPIETAYPDHTDTFLELKCENGTRLRLQGVLFTDPVVIRPLADANK